MKHRYPVGFYVYAALFLVSIFSIGNLITRNESTHLFITYIIAFISYLLLVQQKGSLYILVCIGILARMVLFMDLPSLSDDVFRFIWDGTLIKNGIHPFSQLPTYYLDKEIPGITAELYQKLNSKEYFTIYPPINQFIFWISVLFSDNWLVSTNVIRTILFLADVGSLYLLSKILEGKSQENSKALYFFLNPLIILEFVGNLHFEGLVIFFLILGIYGYKKRKKWMTSLGFGLAVGTKLLPLIYLPALFFKGLKSRTWIVGILAGFIGMLTLIPMVNSDFIRGMQSSLDLYFRSFEFNASIYFIAREVGFWLYGYNNIAKIGPSISLVSGVLILLVSWISLKKDLSMSFTCLLVLTSYLFLTTTVHPWYILPLVVFGLLSGYYYPIVWSFLIFLTYLGYSEAGFELPIYLVVLEYSILWIFILLEFRFKKGAN